MDWVIHHGSHQPLLTDPLQKVHQYRRPIVQLCAPLKRSKRAVMTRLMCIFGAPTNNWFSSRPTISIILPVGRWTCLAICIVYYHRGHRGGWATRGWKKRLHICSLPFPFFSISSYFIICIVYFFFFYFMTFYVGINDSSIVDRKLIFWKAFGLVVTLREVSYSFAVRCLNFKFSPMQFKIRYNPKNHKFFDDELLLARYS